MLKELRFVQGAVAKKDFIPAMTHFRIENGTVRAFNGALALCSPIDFDIDCTPKAETLVRAISRCEGTMTLAMTPGGKLRVQSGKFRAYIDTVEGDVPHILPQGENVHFDGEVLLKAFQTVEPFIGNDASRPWTNGVLLKGKSAFATNNVCVIEYWLGVDVPFNVNIPRAAINEILRVNEPPTHAQVDRNSVTFHYSDGRWIRTQLLDTGWPDLSKILHPPTDNVSKIPEQLFEGLEMLTTFADDLGRIYIEPGMMRTHQEDLGAVYELEGFDVTGLYQAKMLALLKGVAEDADFTRYPEPLIFFGKRIRGAIAAMRM